MELKLYEQVCDPDHLAQLQQLLQQADREFVPPLSARSSTTQQDLGSAESSEEGIRAYFETMKTQPMVLALENGRVAGFMAFRFDHVCEYVGPETLPNLYASTSVVHPDFRGQGLMRRFYETMIAAYPQRGIYTRTWAANASHLHVLHKLGFQQLCCLKDHRGPGVDTVYYGRKP